MDKEKQQLINQFSEELLRGTGAFFIGSGISTPSNLPNWEGLLRPFAENIGIKNLKGSDLPLIAQYIINENAGNRGPFINVISNKIRKKYSPNKYHEWIVKTNVKTIWTTNYDNLLEQAFGNHIIDIKTSDDDMSRDFPDSQVEIIKMHGCIFRSKRDDVVISESDYEDFFVKRPATAQRLRIDLLQKSFLFIGYGYGDPNIKNIITEARRLSNNSTRQHYLITRNSGSVDFKLWCNNLKKYGISVIEIDDFSELEMILEAISLKSRGKSIFITGSHLEADNNDAKKLGTVLADKEDIMLIDGQSSGVLRIAVTAFMERCINQKKDINKRLKFFANPYAANPNFSNDISLIPILKQWRIPLLKETQILIAFDGGMGTMAEIEKAKELGCTIVPYFRKKDDKLHQLLFDEQIAKKINERNNDYLIKARKYTLKITDVITLVESLLENN